MTHTFGITVHQASVTYRNGHTALRDASFEIPTGSIAALVGVNGSGKSTLFKAIMGFVHLAQGSISLLGMPPKKALRQNLVSYVPQSEEVDWSFPVLVEDVVMMGRYGHMGMLRIPGKIDKHAVDNALARVGMSDFRYRQIGELSGGQKSVSSWRALSRRMVRSSCSMSHLPASTSKPKNKLLPCYANCATKDAQCWWRHTI